MPARNIIPGQKIAAQKLARAKQLRREMTRAERTLWQELRGNRLGAHFRRQQIVAGFIVDFYCHAASLAIELDGGIHETSDQKEDDSRRDVVLREMGLRVIRIKNDQIEADLPQVLKKIRELIRS